MSRRHAPLDDAFPHTASALERRGRRAPVALATSAALVAGWTAFLISAELPVTLQTSRARLETQNGSLRIDAPATARVETVDLRLNQRVVAGEALVVFEQAVERAEVERTEAEVLGLEHRLRALDASVRAERAASTEGAALARRAIDRSQAEQLVRNTEAERASVEADRQAHLEGTVAARDIVDARFIARREAEQARVAALSAAERRAEGRARIASAGSQIAKLEAERAEVEALLQVANADASRARVALEARTVRAPEAGLLLALGPISPGRVVAAGDWIVTLVPDEPLRVVASFDASQALGRVGIGQEARVRAHAYPWVTHGELPALVTAVGGDEGPPGRLFVQLLLEDGPLPFPITHGMRCSVHVVTRRESPGRLLMEAAGLLAARTNSDSSREDRPAPETAR